ncbi:hypothetical protein NC653_019297 [Populus alba x Populus x berolinensis]|uniref:PsbP C-terminal domain-containing protein n=1 Tax=Populus alba x Populus x berolinensis TaxID=444605 RepID=A0AAD6QIL6_9ROSI|nr:hypothetical protein NC653_019297 [Populus alba x Populus x berolinensis]
MALRVSFSFTSHSPCQQNHTPKPFSPRTFSSTSLPKASFSNQKQNPESIDDSRKETLTLSHGSSKRRKLSLSVLALLINGSLPNLSNNSILAQELELARYTDSKEGFTLLTPSSYVKVDKAGATVLFEEVNKGSNNIGVVVTPVRLASLGEFGSPQFVADKLIQAEKKKESTKDAEVISVAERSGHGGLQVYEFEYKVDSTRGGMKRIFSAVFVSSKKLYLLNIAHSDKPESPLDTDTRTILEEHDTGRASENWEDSISVMLKAYLAEYFRHGPALHHGGRDVRNKLGTLERDIGTTASSWSIYCPGGMEYRRPEAAQVEEMDPGEKRLNELGYKQELRREMTLFKTLAISFSTMTLFTGITPLYGSSLLYAGPASLVWGWVVVSFFTWFVGIAMAEICSSFPTTGSLYFWAAHLAGPRWGPFASWCCAWLETIGLVAGIGTQAYAGSQTLQSIILLCTGTNKNGGYFAPKWLFLCMYIGLTLIWAVLNTFALEVIAFIDVISIWWQVIGGLVIVIMLPLVSLTTKSASYVFTHFETAPDSTGISSKPYVVVLSFLVSQYSLYGYDAAAHLTEETKGADKNGPIAILSSIGIITVFGWAYILALTFSIQDFGYLYDTSNETAGAFVPAQILYDAFHGRYHNSAGAIVLLFIIWGSFFFGGLSITTSAARVVYALSRDEGIPFSSIWRKIHPKHKVPSNAVWLCAAICILLGLPILKVNVVFTAITSICTIGWVGGYAVPIFARIVMDEKNFKAGPFYLGRARRPVCIIAFLWICYTCSVFLLPTYYPLSWNTFNYAPVAIGVGLSLIMLWWILDARKWFKGPVRNIDISNGKKGQARNMNPAIV